MAIVRKKLQRHDWTKQLRSLKPEIECLEEDVKHQNSIQTQATRLRSEGLYFTFRRNGDKVNVWRILKPSREYRKKFA